jgi:hypothetical protein
MRHKSTQHKRSVVHDHDLFDRERDTSNNYPSITKNGKIKTETSAT